jgi:hypothetical protein
MSSPLFLIVLVECLSLHGFLLQFVPQMPEEINGVHCFMAEPRRRRHRLRAGAPAAGVRPPEAARAEATGNAFIPSLLRARVNSKARANY